MGGQNENRDFNRYMIWVSPLDGFKVWFLFFNLLAFSFVRRQCLWFLIIFLSHYSFFFIPPAELFFIFFVSVAYCNYIKFCFFFILSTFLVKLSRSSSFFSFLYVHYFLFDFLFPLSLFSASFLFSFTLYFFLLICVVTLHHFPFIAVLSKIMLLLHSSVWMVVSPKSLS